MNSPVHCLREMAAFRFEFVFDQEGNHLGQPDCLFLGVSETSDVFTFYQRFPVRGLNMAKRTRRMADQGNRLACGLERLNQFDGVRIFGQIPHRTVAAWVENGVVIVGLNTVETNGRSKLCLCSWIGFKPMCELG